MTSATADELGNRVVNMIKAYAGLAKRAHGELILPDANGKPVPLKSLFDNPTELMRGLIRGGWVIPKLPRRSMLLRSIIGTAPYRGPMQGEFLKEDRQLLTDWITAGAVVPNSDT